MFFFSLHVFQLPTTILARMLLTQYKWDFQRLIGKIWKYKKNSNTIISHFHCRINASYTDEYFETGPETFFQLAHIENPFDKKPNTLTCDDSEQDCKICFSDSPEVGVLTV